MNISLDRGSKFYFLCKMNMFRFQWLKLLQDEGLWLLPMASQITAPDSCLIHEQRGIRELIWWKKSWHPYSYMQQGSATSSASWVAILIDIERWFWFWARSVSRKNCPTRSSSQTRWEHYYSPSVKFIFNYIILIYAFWLIVTFFLKGNTLTSIAYYLATHPDIQDRLIREIDEVLASRGDKPLYDIVQGAVYVRGSRPFASVALHSYFYGSAQKRRSSREWDFPRVLVSISPRTFFTMTRKFGTSPRSLTPTISPPRQSRSETHTPIFRLEQVPVSV